MPKPQFEIDPTQLDGIVPPKIDPDVQTIIDAAAKLAGLDRLVTDFGICERVLGLNVMTPEFYKRRASQYGAFGLLQRAIDGDTDEALRESLDCLPHCPLFL